MYKYQRIKDIREDREMKQTTIARYLNITQQQYSLYETGEREIPLHLMIELADLYRVSLDYLTERTNKKEINK